MPAFAGVLGIEVVPVSAVTGEGLDESVKRRVRATGSKPDRPENRVAGPGGDRKLWEYLTRG